MKSLTQLANHRQRTSLCRTTFAGFYNLTEKAVLICPVCCNSYFCDYCSKRKRNCLVWRIKNWSRNRHLFFYTVTLWTKHYTSRQSAEKINLHFSKLIQFFRRKYGRDFQFFKVLEFTKQGISHLHFLSDVDVPQGVLSRAWRTYSKSFIVKRKDLFNPHLLHIYLTKYLSKQGEDNSTSEFYFLYQKRRFSFSRNFTVKKALKRCWKFYDTHDCFAELLDFIRSRLGLSFFDTSWELCLYNTS